ncbi:Hypothetical protein CINCED_3A012576 [Cinara cedri]|uniref:Enkurin domain-containing protein n=1 Tax=Cinara cedri TaxID=506608 RepID=A0A5E4N7W5_9HEMI|nr:Hypothetical protein CINCED_3A012576 [Cinara cedri]
MSSIRDYFPIQYRVGGTKPKKNFILENRKYVTKLTKTTQLSKNNEGLKLRRITNNSSIPENSKKQSKSVHLDKIDASIKSIRSALAQTKITQEKLNTTSHCKVSLAFRDQGTQTINPYNEESILKDSIIRYPKLENLYFNQIIPTKITNTIAIQTDSSESEYSIVRSKDTLKSIQSDENSNKKQPNLVELKENAISYHQPGEIPKYLKNRKILKEKNEKEEQKKLAIRHELGLDDPACPPGHILLPTFERLDHLAKIKKDYSHLILELNMLPVSSDSYKIKEKRKHLEKELDKLQLGMKLFSKEKLYVKIDPKIINSAK